MCGSFFFKVEHPRESYIFIFIINVHTYFDIMLTQRLLIQLTACVQTDWLNYWLTGNYCEYYAEPCPRMSQKSHNYQTHKMLFNNIAVFETTVYNLRKFELTLTCLLSGCDLFPDGLGGGGATTLRQGYSLDRLPAYRGTYIKENCIWAVGESQREHRHWHKMQTPQRKALGPQEIQTQDLLAVRQQC